MIKKIFIIVVSAFLLTACVDQKTGKIEKKNMDNPKIIATSISCADIMDKLDLDLIAISDTQSYELPQRYKDLPRVGMAMMPDVEIIKSLNPDYVFSPVSLMPDLLPKYEASGVNYGFINLNNVDGMYKSIEDLGNLLNRKSQAQKLIKEHEDFMKSYREKNKDKKKLKVLVLMGLPGSYVVATENSYAGSLVELSGAENVYSGTNKQFLNVNTEDILSKDPDIILRTSHALPDEVQKMFQEEFKNNNIWSHFRAVKENKVYDLDHNKFGMSAKFNYKDALNDLGEIFYGK